MALAISHVPVLTGEVAERFEREAEYNEKYMRGSQYNPEAFEMVRRVEENTRKYYESLKCLISFCIFFISCVTSFVGRIPLL